MLLNGDSAMDGILHSSSDEKPTISKTGLMI